MILTQGQENPDTAVKRNELYSTFGWTLDRLIGSGSNMRTSHHPLRSLYAVPWNAKDQLGCSGGRETYTAMMEQDVCKIEKHLEHVKSESTRRSRRYKIFHQFADTSVEASRAAIAGSV